MKKSMKRTLKNKPQKFLEVEIVDLEMNLSNGTYIKMVDASNISIRFMYCFLSLDEQDQKEIIRALSIQDRGQRANIFKGLYRYDESEKEEIKDILGDIIDKDKKENEWDLIVMAMSKFLFSEKKSYYTRWIELEKTIIDFYMED